MTPFIHIMVMKWKESFKNDDNIASSAQPNAKPGELKFKNQDSDNAITSNDRVVLGKPFPDVTFWALRIASVTKISL